jgi:HTH-type transcriptional regulator, cell division transcriptional repressor
MVWKEVMSVSKKPSIRRQRNLVGSRVCKARLDHPDKLTQDQLAGRLAVAGVALDRVTVAKIETGIRCVYDYEVIALAKALNVDVVWLLGLTDQPRIGNKKNSSQKWDSR